MVPGRVGREDIVRIAGGTERYGDCARGVPRVPLHMTAIDPKPADLLDEVPNPGGQ